MIDRRHASLAVGLGLFVGQQRGHGQSAPKRRVGVLTLQSRSAFASAGAALLQEMTRLGWLEGGNVEYRFAYADGDVNRLDPLVHELLAWNGDALVVGSSQGVRAVQHATKTIPVVMAYISDPVGNGFVASLARPGGNITGTATLFEDFGGKILEALHEVLPSARRIAFLINGSNPSTERYWTRIQRDCAALDLVAIRVLASAPEQLVAAVESIVRQRAQAVVVLADGMYFEQRTKLQALLEPTRLPVAHGLNAQVAFGGLLSYAPDVLTSYAHAANYVDKILRGARPADLPVEQPNKFELVINLKTAKALGLTIPQTVLVRADEVIH